MSFWHLRHPVTINKIKSSSSSSIENKWLSPFLEKTPDLGSATSDKRPPVETDPEDPLRSSMKRLEAAGISIAIWEDGSMRVIVSKSDSAAAIKDGGTIYSPRDMYYFVQLPPQERMVLHDMKRRFGGTIRWTEHGGGADQCKQRREAQKEER